MDQEKQQKWEDLINEWRRSGLTQTEYCFRNNLNRYQFCYQKRRQEILISRSGGIITDASKNKNGGEAMGEFLPLPFQFTPNRQVPAGTGKLEIVLHNDIRLIVPEGFEPKPLAILVRLLAEVRE